MSEAPAKTPSPSTAVIHFYRAVVGHADVWRQRMDATTNWAAATTAAMITFAFSAGSPHFVLLLTLAFDGMFLLMESRRYRTYHLWRRRFYILNRYVISPALMGRAVPPQEEIEQALEDLALDLGRTVPRLSMADAVGFRIYRNYGFIFIIVLLAWLLKLGVDPTGAAGPGELVERAAIGSLPGAAVMGAVAFFGLGAAWLAIRAPSERMVDWNAAPSLLGRWLARVRPRRAPEEPPLTGVDE